MVVNYFVWAILGLVLVAEVLDLIGEDPTPDGSMGPLAVLAAGWLFGSRVIRNGKEYA